MPRYPKKLIEVALPLNVINVACSKEKSIRHGHPSTLHLWWSRKPLAAARAVLFAQLVNDPGGHRGWGSIRGQTKGQAKQERERLFGIIGDLVQWENTNNEEVLERARVEICKSWKETCSITGENPDILPSILDPFAGGGTIPLEAQRLGLEAHGSDLNPVPVLINKALIEIPSKFKGKDPIGPSDSTEETVKRTWPGATGLAEDVRRYGRLMRHEAMKRIGHLYSEINLPNDQGGGKATVIAWIWARTVKSPNPAYSECDVPICASFMLSTKPGKEFWSEPVIEGRTFRFVVRSGKPPTGSSAENGTKTGRGGNFTCILSDSPIDDKHIKDQGKTGQMGQMLMAVVAEGKRGRIYLTPTKAMIEQTHVARPKTKINIKLNHDPRNIWCVNYGVETYEALFTSRQLVLLDCYCGLVNEIRSAIVSDAISHGWNASGRRLAVGGIDAEAYADAVAVYLGLGISKMTDYNCTLVSWSYSRDQAAHAFTKQAIPMIWGFAEVNPFAEAAGDLCVSLEGMCQVLERGVSGGKPGKASVQDATSNFDTVLPIISTDPPYYDNISYADLSDFFYVWLRLALRDVYPDLFSTVLTPKAEELVATPYRHGSKGEAHTFFSQSMNRTLRLMAEKAHPAHPLTIYYAFKQSETSGSGTVSFGWEAFLKAVIDSGFRVTGTWPMRTERGSRSTALDANSLASSIVLVCRTRASDAESITRRQFIKELSEQLPLDLEDMINGTIGISPVAPVDLAQAAIGPGMAIFSQYASVIEADGSAMSVHQALLLINKAIDEYFDATEGRMDGLTRFCTRWLSTYGFSAGPYGEADGLSRACGLSVANSTESIDSGKGKTRLRTASEHDCEKLPELRENPSIWTSLHRLAGRLEAGDNATAGSYLARIPQHSADIRALAYRLYTLCERAKLSDAARTYNNIMTSWDAIVYGSELAGVVGKQKNIFDADGEVDSG